MGLNKVMATVVLTVVSLFTVFETESLAARVRARELKLLTASTDAFRSSLSFYDFYLSIDNRSGQISGLKCKRGSSVLAEYSARDMLKRGGAPLITMMGFPVVTFIAQDMDVRNGGTFKLEYLGKGTNADLMLELHRDGSNWKIYRNEQNGRREVKKIFFKAWKPSGRAMGIESISFD